MKRWMMMAGVVVVAGGAAGVWWWRSPEMKGPTYRTVAAETGDLIQTVRAAGTVNPMRLVDVGTQVNGPIRKLYVDFNDRVKAGDLVAVIDPTVYQARLAQERANVLQSEASVDQAQVRLVQAEKDLVRARELARRDMLSQADLDAAVAARDALAAQLKVAQAEVEQSKASLQLAQANLDYTVIRSPVDGVVIKRSVSEGQTVVASMSAPVLFQIATDLSKMEIAASVPEADVGSIQEGQPVKFTVDAYPDEFQGKVAQIRLSALTVQNVVTYPVIIRADNPDGKLFPGMTANVICEVAHLTDVLRVPNAALRFKLSGDKGDARAKTGSRVWVLREPRGLPEAVKVKAGITDGLFTELREAAGIKAGDLLVVGTNGVAGEVKETVNPFAPPRMPGMRRPR